MSTRTAVLFVMLICAAAVFAQQDEKKGVVTYSDGQVKRKPLTDELWQSAPVKTEILSGDKIRTYRQSRAEIDLAQLDIVRLAPQTIIDILKLYEETEEKKLKTQINLEQGEIWANVHKVQMETEFDISSPVSAAAITGTVLRLKVAADSTTQLKVYTGEVRITNAPENRTLTPTSVVPHQIEAPHEIPGPVEVSVEEWLYIVKQMEQITFDKSGKIVSKGKFNTNDYDEKNTWVQWNRQRDRVTGAHQ
ncbi:FecR domain-containing protein [bacterium]|nr:FecR domain-containing protein [bacterium]